MYIRYWREPVQLELPFPPHAFSNVVDLCKRIKSLSSQNFLGFTSFDPIQLELPFPYPDSPKVLDFFACVQKLSRAA